MCVVPMVTSKGQQILWSWSSRQLGGTMWRTETAQLPRAAGVHISSATVAAILDWA